MEVTFFPSVLGFMVDWWYWFDFFFFFLSYFAQKGQNKSPYLQVDILIRWNNFFLWSKSSMIYKPMAQKNFHCPLSFITSGNRKTAPSLGTLWYALGSILSAIKDLHFQINILISQERDWGPQQNWDATRGKQFIYSMISLLAGNQKANI